MSKNVKLNNTNYTGISTVQLPTADGGTATFQDVDEITESGGGGFELKGTYTVSKTGYIYKSSTIDQAVFTPSYSAGIIILVADSADTDWSDNVNGVSRVIVIYTSNKYILVSQGYRNGTGEQFSGNNAPVERTTTGAGNAIEPTFGNTYNAYINAGQSVKKYEMKLDSNIAEAFLYYSA